MWATRTTRRLRDSSKGRSAGNLRAFPRTAQSWTREAVSDGGRGSCDAGRWCLLARRPGNGRCRLALVGVRVVNVRKGLERLTEWGESRRAHQLSTFGLLLLLAVAPWQILWQQHSGREAEWIYVNALILLVMGGWYLSYVLQPRAWRRTRLHGIARRKLALPLLVTMLSMFLNSFTSVYWTLSWGSPSSFNEPLTKMDALYFTLTTFSTTGYGDIHPLTEAARAVVSVQMMIDVLLLTVAAAIVINRAFERDEEAPP